LLWGKDAKGEGLPAGVSGALVDDIAADAEGTASVVVPAGPPPHAVSPNMSSISTWTREPRLNGKDMSTSPIYPANHENS
jgi:hypothetical protein